MDDNSFFQHRKNGIAQWKVGNDVSNKLTLGWSTLLLFSLRRGQSCVFISIHMCPRMIPVGVFKLRLHSWMQVRNLGWQAKPHLNARSVVHYSNSDGLSRSWSLGLNERSGTKRMKENVKPFGQIPGSIPSDQLWRWPTYDLTMQFL